MLADEAKLVTRQDATGRWRIYERTGHGDLLAQGLADKSFKTYSRALKFINGFVAQTKVRPMATGIQKTEKAYIIRAKSRRPQEPAEIVGVDVYSPGGAGVSKPCFVCRYGDGAIAHEPIHDGGGLPKYKLGTLPGLLDL